MYSNKILEIFKSPSCAGGLQGANGVGKYIDEVCGDFVKIYLKIDDNQEIIEARFKTMGSVGTIVASSVLCGMLSGISITEAQELNVSNILEVTGEYPEDKRCSLDFAIRSLNLAIADYFQRLEKEDKPKRKKVKENKKINHEENQEKVENDLDVFEEEPASTLLTETNLNEENNNGIPDENGKTFETTNVEMVEQEEVLTTKEDIVQNNEQLQKNTSIDENIDDEYDAFFNDYDEELFDENEELENNTLKSEEKLDPVDIFLRAFGENAKTIEVKNMANGSKKVSLTSANDDESQKASKMVEDAKSFKPVVETKITKGTMDNEPKEQVKKSSAKAMFDAMFEE